MSKNIIVYTVVHQPRRLKLPAQPIPKGANVNDIAQCLFDEKMNEKYFHKVARTCYYPAADMFQSLVDRGLRLSIGFSYSFLRQAQIYDASLLKKFQQLVSHPNVELVGVEPYHSFLFYLDVNAFIKNMQDMVSFMEYLFGKRPVVTDTTEMFQSNEIYFALAKAGFKGTLVDGRPWVMGWRQPSYLYKYDGGPYIFPRHYQLSDDVGYRFSNKHWSGYPLFADTYADWLTMAKGDFVFLGWDFETFGEHHRREMGIFEFMKGVVEEVQKRQGEFILPSEAMEKFAKVSHTLPLSQHPSTWAGEGSTEFFLGNSVQQSIFRLMHHAYHKALLTNNTELVELAMWLLQSDNLHLVQWFGKHGNEAEVSAYFTPSEWWRLTPAGIVWEMQQVYKNFIQAMDAHIPFIRQQQTVASYRPVLEDILYR